MTATKARPKREPLIKLATVEYRRDLSTAWHEHWEAKSDSHIGLVHHVNYNVDADKWTCVDADMLIDGQYQCPGFVYRGWCHHCQRCKQCRAVQWHHALRLGVGPRQLLAERAHLMTRVEDGMHTEDDLDALDALALLTQWGDDRAA